ncbi:MAG: glycine cleavage system protein GcvH [Acidimicrobiia bacterium]|nr:glycine cleavage system protein GcvH [Acidimicrobiia bacterium]
MQVPEDLLYTPEHEWIRKMGDSLIRIGITDYAQDQLGDIVYVELPTSGASVAKEDLVAEIESTKSVGEVYSPVAGEITSINESVAENPELVNKSPYDEGWLAEIAIDGELDDSALLDAEGYRNLTE